MAASVEEIMNGWTCPKYGRVYAPHVKECAECNKKCVKVERWIYPVEPWYPGTGDRWPWYRPYITWTDTTTTSIDYGDDITLYTT